MDKNDTAVDVTIVIPVYNVEHYIRANIESLIALKNPNIEFLYIDDGSPDHSVEIIEEYQKMDNRIRIIRQKNGGLSAARNTGINAARGKWILFVDGDDWVNSELTEELFYEANDENDIIWGAYQTVNNEGQPETVIGNENLLFGTIKDGIEWALNEKIVYVPWIYLYKKKLLQENQVMFPVGLLHEDMEFIPEIFYYAKKVKYVGAPFYQYVNRAGSISQTKNLKRTLDLVQIAKRLEVFEKNNVSNGAYKRYLKAYRGRICAGALHIAILDGIHLQPVFAANPKFRKTVIRYLFVSSRKRDRIAAVLIFCHLQWLYEKLYQLYNRQRR